MEKQEYKSKWDELARELGAEISPEIEQREEAVSAAQESGVGISRAADESSETRLPLPKRTAVDWDNLAGELGLPPAPPDEKPIEPPKEQRPVAREEPRRDEARKQADRREPPRREAERREQPRGHRQDRPPRQERGGRRDRGERSDQRRDHRDKRRPPRDFDAESEADREVRPSPQEVIETHAGEQPAPAAPVHDEPQKPAAVSLWHKIFGSPAEQTAKLAEETDRPEVVEPSDMRDEPRDAGSGFADAHPDEAPLHEGDDEFAGDGGTSVIPEERETSERRGGRSRRRRGRGRGRRSELQEAEGRSAEARAPRRPRTADVGESEDRIDDEDLDDAISADLGGGGDEDDIEESLEGADGAGSSRGRSVLQRAIPSWEEAIGFIVDSNLQSRSQRRPPSRPGGPDRGRGRSRGRRKQ
jgi:hypothetical protein